MPRFILGLAMLAIAHMAPSVATAQTDQQVAQRIKFNLEQSGLLRNYSVGVKYKAGTGVLVGYVTSEQQKRTAVQIARKTPHVKVVLEQLQLKNATQLTAAHQPATNPAVSQPRSRHQPQSHDASGMSGNLKSGLGRIFGQRQSSPANRGAPMPLGPAAATAGRRPTQQIPTGYGHGHSRPVGYNPAVQQQVVPAGYGRAGAGQPIPSYAPGGHQVARTRFDRPHLPPYAWPSYAAHPNYAAVTYPQQYSPTAWPYIGPFYPYPQVPLGWRKVQLEWDDGWWRLKFINKRHTNY